MVEVVYERCAGLDVGKDEVVACVRVPDGAGGRFVGSNDRPEDSICGW